MKIPEIIDLDELDDLAYYWLCNTCSELDNWCEGADWDKDGDVDLVDFSKLAQYWMMPMPEPIN